MYVGHLSIFPIWIRFNHKHIWIVRCAVKPASALAMKACNLSMGRWRLVSCNLLEGWTVLVLLLTATPRRWCYDHVLIQTMFSYSLHVPNLSIAFVQVLLCWKAYSSENRESGSLCWIKQYGGRIDRRGNARLSLYPCVDFGCPFLRFISWFPAMCDGSRTRLREYLC